MAYDERLAARVRAALSNRVAAEERKMFGGLAFLARGSMCCGIVGDMLMVRVGPERYQEALARPDTRPMDFTGRPMRGMIFVTAKGVASAPAVAHWVDLALAAPPPKARRKPAPAGRHHPR